MLFVTTGFGEVFALDPRTGGTIWQRTLEAPIRAAPVVAGGRVVAVQRDDTAYALDARTGETLWRVQGIGGHRAARRRQPGGRRPARGACPSPRARCWACWRATG